MIIASLVVNDTPPTPEAIGSGADVLSITAPVIFAFTATLRLPPILTALVVVSEVNTPELAVVLPIGPGLAKRAVKPAPETDPDALSVVNAPVFGVVFPIAGGAAGIASTEAVVASCVVFVPAAAVGAVGVPVSAGDAFGASRASAAVARLASTATATAAKAAVPICVVLVRAAAVGAVGTPVSTGEANGAAPGISDSASVTAPERALTDDTPVVRDPTSAIT